MGWKELIHDNCNLPDVDDVEKSKAKQDSVYECHDVGCGRLYQLDLEEGYWIEIERMKVQDRPVIYKYMQLTNKVEIEGFAQRQKWLKQNAERDARMAESRRIQEQKLKEIQKARKLAESRQEQEKWRDSSSTGWLNKLWK